MKIFIKYALLVLIITSNTLAQQDLSGIKLARVKYSGGGDWYNDPSAEVNLLKYIASNTNINVDPKYEYVDLSSKNLYMYPMIFLTGHGNLKFTEKEADNLKEYLENGGFLYVDDDYGLDTTFRQEITKVFKDKELVELPFSHPIFHSHFEFPNGLPKTHEHDDKIPQAFGIFHKGRLVLLYTFESNPSDGWADPASHNDPPEKRETAFKIGTNIVVYALTH